MEQILIEKNMMKKTPAEVKRIRELVHSMVGIVPNKEHEDSVEEVRKIRRKLSKEDMDINHINNL